MKELKKIHVSQTTILIISNEEKQMTFFKFLNTLGASLLGNMLTGKEMLRAGYENKKKINSTHPLTNIEIQMYYQIELRFNGVYSRDDLLKEIKD